MNNQVKSYLSFLSDAYHTMENPRLLSDSLFFRGVNGNMKKGVCSLEIEAN